MPTLEIFDQQNGFLNFDLRDLLEVIESFAAKYDWYVIEFEPAGLATSPGGAKGSPPSWVTELWHKSEAGSVQALSWQRLKELSTHIRQTMNALFVATDPGSAAPSCSMDPNDKGYKLVIQAVDTAFWAVTSGDENLLRAIKVRFRDVKSQPVTKRYF